MNSEEQKNVVPTTKLKLKQEKKEELRFNTLEELEKVIGPDKMLMFTHKARYVDIIGAKDTGKSFPLELYKLYIMERDPMASVLTLMKYSTNASKRGTRSLYSALSALRRKDYKFPYAYEPSTSHMYRMKDKKIRINNQAIEYGSFENSDALAGYTVSNGGYPALIHIEEPVLQGDKGETATLNQWNADIQTIEDTIQRHWRDYASTNPHFAPIPFKIVTTMNDWDPEHPVSKRAEKYHPQMKFLDWCLGFEYSRLLNLWKDKIRDAETVIPALKTWVDERWSEIQQNVLRNHTQFVYVERDPITNIKEDRLIGRMQKFANPVVRESEEQRENVYDQMYMALVTGDRLGLAKSFGMGFGGTADEDKIFNFKSFVPIDTDAMLKEDGRELLAFSVAWDHDANRGPVATPCTLSAIKYNAGNPFEPIIAYKDYKVLIHPQVLIEGYGKGTMGQNTAIYHKQMVEVSAELYKKYVGKNNGVETFATFDDDDGSYVSHIGQSIVDIGYNYVDALKNKNGMIENEGFGVISRDKIWQSCIDVNDIMVDEQNVLLCDWLKTCPSVVNPAGEKKRSTEGKWGKRYKDVSNSAEYAWWPFRYNLFGGL